MAEASMTDEHGQTDGPVYPYRPNDGAPANPENDLRLGLEAYFSGDFVQSVRILKRVLVSAPESGPALLIIAHAAYRQREWTEAARAAERLLARFPDHADARAILAAARAGAGAWEEAAAQYRDLLAVEDRKRGWSIVARILTKCGEWGDRAKRARDRLPPERRRSAGRETLARALANDGQWQEVAAIAHAALARRPDDAQALALALKAAIRIGRPEHSLPLWTELARSDPQEVVRWIRILDRQDRLLWAVYALLGLSTGRGATFEILAEHSRLAGSLTRRVAQARRSGDGAAAARATDALALMPSLHPAQRLAEHGAAFPVSDDATLLRDPILAPVLSPDIVALVRASDGAGPVKAGEPPASPWAAELAQAEAALARGAFGDASRITGDLARRFPDQNAVRHAMRTIMRARLQAARNAVRESRFAEVIALLSDADVQEADRNEADALLARAYLAEGRFQASIEHWRRVAAQTPDNAKAWTYIARCCKPLRLWQEGRDAALRKLAIEPGDAKTRALLDEFERKLAP
jgi:tetratricopeptide (TPR) repeat protein